MLVFIACRLLLLLLLSLLLLLLLLLLLTELMMLEMVFTEIRRKAIKANGEKPLGAGAGHSFKTKYFHIVPCNFVGCICIEKFRLDLLRAIISFYKLWKIMSPVSQIFNTVELMRLPFNSK